MQRFIIRPEDWRDHRYQFYKNDQKTLAILKDKGAPIKGTFLLKANTDEYNWKREKDSNDNCEVFYVRRKY
jgi:hypothetical protein